MSPVSHKSPENDTFRHEEKDDWINAGKGEGFRENRANSPRPVHHRGREKGKKKLELGMAAWEEKGLKRHGQIPPAMGKKPILRSIRGGERGMGENEYESERDQNPEGGER